MQQNVVSSIIEIIIKIIMTEQKGLWLIMYLNNKGRMQGYISSMCVCLCVCVCVFVCVCLSARDLRNGGTYEYAICTAYWCDDTDEDEVSIFYIFWIFLE